MQWTLEQTSCWWAKVSQSGCSSDRWCTLTVQINSLTAACRWGLGHKQMWYSKVAVQTRCALQNNATLLRVRLYAHLAIPRVNMTCTIVSILSLKPLCPVLCAPLYLITTCQIHFFGFFKLHLLTAIKLNLTHEKTRLNALNQTKQCSHFWTSCNPIPGQMNK